MIELKDYLIPIPTTSIQTEEIQIKISSSLNLITILTATIS